MRLLGEALVVDVRLSEDADEPGLEPICLEQLREPGRDHVAIGEIAFADGQDARRRRHGGLRGFDKVLWAVSDVRTFSYVSPDGEDGYPGDLHVSVTYVLDDSGALTIHYAATTTRPTIVNLTNHSLFNMAGAASRRDVLGKRLTIAASAITAVDAGLIPTGALQPVAGGSSNFRTARGSASASATAAIRSW